jgi:hypothetical protein
MTRALEIESGSDRRDTIEFPGASTVFFRIEFMDQTG